MPRKKVIKAKVGDVFAIPIENNQYGFGQIISNASLFNNLYILFDYITEGIPDINNILNKPILAIAHLDNGSIEDGDWTVISNEKVVLKKIKYPNYLIDGDFDENFKLKKIVKKYDGEFIREATEQDLRELNRHRSYTSNVFDNIIKAKYNEKKVNNYYSSLLDISKWIIQDDDPDESSLYEIVNLENNTQRNDKDDLEEENSEEQIAIYYKLNGKGFGTEEDLSKKYEIEEFLNSALQKSGLGDCDGGEIGGGEMIIFCYVKNFEKGLEVIKQELHKHGHLEKATFSY